ncbi:BsuPI-related putative proteinase inhibitor [Alkaliphilus pronyensis]|nr:BsuPI-related putative proteinase inhibitor [Alkaliphilus pronyensis]
MKSKSTVFIACVTLAIMLFSNTLVFGMGVVEAEKHWASPYIEDLRETVDFDFKVKELEKPINVEELNKLVNVFLSYDNQLQLENTTREAVVNEFVKIWSEITNKSLDEIALPKLIVFPDEDTIDEKYRWNVLIAYSQGLVQGKNGYFAPKAKVTYAEAYTLLSRLRNITTEAKEGKVLEVNSTHQVNDDGVKFNFELTNNSSTAQTLEFSSGQQFEVVIQDEDGNEVYRYSDGKFFTMALIYEELNPQASIGWSDTWDKKDKNGNLLEKGSFTVTIDVLAKNLERLGNSKEALKIQFDFTL